MFRIKRRIPLLLFCFCFPLPFPLSLSVFETGFERRRRKRWMSFSHDNIINAAPVIQDGDSGARNVSNSSLIR